MFDDVYRLGRHQLQHRYRTEHHPTTLREDHSLVIYASYLNNRTQKTSHTIRTTNVVTPTPPSTYLPTYHLQFVPTPPKICVFVVFHLLFQTRVHPNTHPNNLHLYISRARLVIFVVDLSICARFVAIKV